MKNLIKKLFGCWHSYEEVSYTNEITIYQCTKCPKVKTEERV